MGDTDEAVGEIVSLARQAAKEAWVERAQREKGDSPLSPFEQRAAERQFERWWDIEYEQ